MVEKIKPHQETDELVVLEILGDQMVKTLITIS